MKYLIGEKLNLDWKIALISVVSTLLLIFDQYRMLTPNKYYDRVILYLFIPLIITLLIFRENPKEYGFSLGDWRLGITLTLIGILVMTPAIYYLARGDSETQKYYGASVVGLPWTTFLNLIGWEFFFRGWILFGYARKFGHESLWLQAVPFALAHIAKPEIETLSTIFGGFAFGWIAYRTKSFIYPFLIHWYISAFIILVASGLIP
jgi:membrane protease YdiL (CAAX protease family)